MIDLTVGNIIAGMIFTMIVSGGLVGLGAIIACMSIGSWRKSEEVPNEVLPKDR